MAALRRRQRPRAPRARLGHRSAVDREPIDPAALTTPVGKSLLPKEADAYFRAERVRAGDTLDQSFSILLVTNGEGAVGDVPVGRGSTVLIPHAAGTTPLSGDLEAIRCLPPDPAGEAAW